MRVALLPLAAALSLNAQAPFDLFEKAPPDVDQALRARITRFYQAHQDGKFRLADEMVAEDTKDFFFAANKTRYLSFEIVKISYSDQFTKAKATVLCETQIAMPGFAGRPVKIAVASTWKVERGEWYWYVAPEELNMTPFGRMSGGPGTGNPLGAPPAMPQNPATLLTLVKADRSSVNLKPGAREEITISNGMPGAITLKFDHPPLPGLAVTADRLELKAGEKSVVTFEWKGEPDRGPVTVTVQVQPTGQTLPIQVQFSGK